MLILAMSYSGSMFFLILLICIFCGKKILSSTWIYAMLKINLLFYCIPLPLLKNRYYYFFSQMMEIPSAVHNFIYPMKNIIQISKTGNQFWNWKLPVLVIWFIWGAGLFFLFIRYFKQYNAFKNIKMFVIEDSNYLDIFERTKRELGVRRKVLLICAKDEAVIYTAGIFKKYIIIPIDGIESKNLYYIFKHELIHIKREDIIYKYIALLALVIHWFNPFIYFYFYLLSIYCEQSCDAALVYCMEKDERKLYGELLIKIASYKKKGEEFQNYFSSKRNIGRRLENIYKVKKAKKIIKVCSFFISGIILFAGSLTVFAYEQPGVVIWQVESNLGETKSGQVERGFINHADIKFNNSEAITVREFIGEDGTSYKLGEEGNYGKGKKICSHSFISGYYKEHVKYSDNSCRTDYYNADRCGKCGEVVIKNYSHTETSTRCTH